MLRAASRASIRRGKAAGVAAPIGARMTRWLLLGLALSLGACAGRTASQLDAAQEAALNAFPTDYRSQLLSLLRTALNDPKFRDASISEPVLKPISGTVSRYVVCVHFNDQNAADARPHTKDKLAIFFHGSVNQLIDANPDQCGSVIYEPLVEPGSASHH